MSALKEVAKTCRKCDVDLVIGDNWSEAAEKARAYICRPCRSEKGREYYEANITAIAEKRMMSRFGITLEQYDKMLFNQNGKCACCGKHHTDEHYSLAVDHDHNTGAVRALLCGGCNRAFGIMGDNVKGVKQLYDYALTYCDYE